jgi:hypothetical protein
MWWSGGGFVEKKKNSSGGRWGLKGLSHQFEAG